MVVVPVRTVIVFMLSHHWLSSWASSNIFEYLKWRALTCVMCRCQCQWRWYVVYIFIYSCFNCRHSFYRYKVCYSVISMFISRWCFLKVDWLILIYEADRQHSNINSIFRVCAMQIYFVFLKVKLSGHCQYRLFTTR